MTSDYTFIHHTLPILIGLLVLAAVLFILLMIHVYRLTCRKMISRLRDLGCPQVDTLSDQERYKLRLLKEYVTRCEMQRAKESLESRDS